MAGDAERYQSTKSFYLLGRDVAKIPCFKNSWITGITSGIGAGLLTFMFTSKTRLASHVAVGTISGVTLIYFCGCRYKFHQEQEKALQIRGLMFEALDSPDSKREENIKKIDELIDS